MEEKRAISRIDFSLKSVVVVCDTQERYFVEVENVSPLGMGLKMPAETPNLVGKAIIIVAETLIMYADVMRQVEQEDGSFKVGINAKKFTPDVLEFLFERIKFD
jgi:hypothetical protein